jgi:pre-mRNA-splicing factor ATP-dependent RNA helicase DHX16
MAEKTDSLDKTDNAFTTSMRLTLQEKIEQIAEKMKDTNFSITNLSDEERRIYFENMRQESRYKFLGPEEEKQIELRKMQLDEEEKMFKGVQLGKKEQAMFELRKRQLQIAMETKGNTKDTEAYQLPEMYDDDDGMVNVQKRHEVLYKRYQDVKEDLREEEVWENEQVKKAKVQFSNEFDRDTALKKRQAILDNGIDFVKIDVMNELKSQLIEKKMKKKFKKEKKRRHKERKRLRKKGIQVDTSSSEEHSADESSSRGMG